MMDKTRLVVRIEAQLDWLEPPSDTPELIMREQANVKLGAIAYHFEKPLKQLIEAAYLRADYD